MNTQNIKKPEKNIFQFMYATGDRYDMYYEVVIIVDNLKNGVDILEFQETFRDFLKTFSLDDVDYETATAAFMDSTGLNWSVPDCYLPESYRLYNVFD